MAQLYFISFENSFKLKLLTKLITRLLVFMHGAAFVTAVYQIQQHGGTNFNKIMLKLGFYLYFIL